MLFDETKYKLEKEVTIGGKKYSIFTPVNIMDGYHMSRYIEANVQQVYANAGIEPELLRAIATEMIERINSHGKTALTDVAALANNILYRLQYPVDNLCAIRVGAILSFMAIDDVEEVPEKYNAWWTDKKVLLALDNPDLYAFFLGWGFANIQQYREALNTSISTDYFQQRELAQQSLMGAEPYKVMWMRYITELTKRVSDAQTVTNKKQII